MKTLDTVFLVLSCFCFITITSGKSGFILTSPKAIDAGSSEYFTLTLFNVPDNGIVTLSLRRKANNETIAQSVASALNKYNMWIEMTIPPIQDSEAWLQIEGRFSGDYQINQTKSVKIRHQSIITLVQTDKPVYKPGQTVKFRVLPLDSLLKPLRNIIGDIWMEDPAGVRIAQWKEMNFTTGIVQLELPLSDEPVFGVWSIKTHINSFSHTQTFDVEEYVLPKFEVIIKPPSYIMADAHAIITEICAQYTYGKKVDGLLKATITYKKYPWEKEEKGIPSVDHEGMISGCHPFLVKSADLLLHTHNFGHREILITAEVTENGTEIKQNASVVKQITHTPLILTFLGADKGNRYFKPGLPFYETLFVTKPDHRPAQSEHIEICATAKRNGDFLPKVACKEFTTDKNGEIVFFIPPLEPAYYKVDLQATAKRYTKQPYVSWAWGTQIHQPEEKVTLKAWYSPTGSYLQIEPITKDVQCEKLEQVRIRYTTYNGSTVNFYHQVISRGRIVQQGSHHRTYYFTENSRQNLDDPRALSSVEGSDVDASVATLPPHVGEFILSFDSRATMSPIARLLVFYVRPDGEVVSDSREFHITHCLLNKAHLNFRHEQQYPSTEAAIHLSASPSSLCGLGLVDKSVYLMSPDKQINKQKVFGIMEGFDIGASAQPLQTSEDHCSNSAWHSSYDMADPEPYDNFHFPSMYVSYHVDAITAFEDAGMVVMSDFVLETRPCHRRLHYYHRVDNLRGGMEIAGEMRDPLGPQGFVFFRSGNTPVQPAIKTVDVMEEDDAENSPPKSVKEIRSYFPETWLWELHELGESGEVAFKRKLPDTVTEWMGNAICVHSETGLGISDTASITAFQPFFVSFSLPYSVIREEVVPVIISVFNYLSECLPIKLSLEPNEAFKIIRESRMHKLCICGGESMSHRFYIRPVALGNVNITVYGFSLEEDIICGNEITARLTARDAVTRQLLVEAEGFPKEEIFNNFFCPQQSNGTFSTEVDLLLPENVVQGSARAYVSVTGDLMGPALDKLDKLVRLPVGCGEQNMILFAPNIFVLDYLTETGRITEEIKSKAVSHMKTGYQRELRYRHPDGSYSAFGASDDEGSMWLTAFVVRSFSQARRFIPIDENDLSRSTSWIVEKQFENGCFAPIGTVLHSGMKGGLADSDQSLAPLTAYVLLALLEAGYTNPTVLNSAMYCIRVDTTPSTYSLALYAYATTLAKDTQAQDYLTRLESRAIREGGEMYWKYEKTTSKSIDIEISAYAVLAMLEMGGLSSVPKVMPIVRWIAKQRNANGGFVSTQDTVMALQALAKYASFNTQSQTNMDVAVEGDQLKQSFKIDESNKLTMQKVKFPLVPTVADFQATGEGCALAQFTLRYNVESIPGSEAFDLRVATSWTGNHDCNEATLGICMRYKIQGKNSNMIVVTVKMISGYVPDEWSLQQLQKDKQLGLKRHDVSGNYVHFYFYELTNEQKCFQFLIKNDLEVENAKPATVKLYDYYQTEWEVTKNYEIPSTCVPSSQPPELPNLPPLEPEESNSTSNESLDTEHFHTGNTTDVDSVADDDENKITDELTTADETAIENETVTLPTDSHLEPMSVNNSLNEVQPPSDDFDSDEITTAQSSLSGEETMGNSNSSESLDKDIPLSDDESQVQSDRTFSPFDQFAVVENDLDTPGGLEGNEPVSVTPPEDFVPPDVLPPPDCPVCYTDFPLNFTDIYCSAAFALRAIIRDGNAGIIRILHDVSSYLNQPRAVKEFGTLSYDQRCTCPILDQKETLIWLIGTSADLWSVKTGKHSIVLHSGSYVISTPKKSVQPPQVKKARSECDGVP